MPAPKKMIRGGGDLPRNPALLKKKPSDAAETPQGPTQLELVPESPAAPVSAPEPAQESDGIVLTIKSNKLKESEGKSREGKPPVYRSVTGEDAEGKSYWMALEMEDANPQKGEQYIVSGQERKPFGKKDNPLHPIDVSSIKLYDPAAEIAESANVLPTSADALVDMKVMLNKYNICGVLQALTDALK